MDPTKTASNGRALAQIEAELLKAEAAYIDADTRLREAERDRQSALDTINSHQVEFDQAVAELRRRSTPGSRWREQLTHPGDPLELGPESIAEEPYPTVRPALKSVASDFDRLKFYAQPPVGEEQSQEARSGSVA